MKNANVKSEWVRTKDSEPEGHIPTAAIPNSLLYQIFSPIPHIMEPYTTDAPKTLTVKELDIDDRPREKALKHGVKALTNSECLAIILRAGIPGHPITEIAKELMKQNDNKFLNLQRMTDQELTDIPGVGPVKVLELRVIMEVMSRYHNETIGERPIIRNSRDIYMYFKYINANLPHEEMWALFLDNSNHVIGKMRSSIGSATATIHDPKKILKAALVRNAQSVILCHNHPSGVLKPSVPDMTITDNFSKACKAVELRFLDHLIVSTEGFYSFHDEGRM